MGRRVLEFKDTVLRHFAVPGLVLLIGSAARSPRAAPPPPRNSPSSRRQSAEAPAPRTPAQDRRIRGGCASDQRPGRQPGMRLARPPRGALDVARRSRPAFRHLDLYERFGCSGRPCPGDLSLPDPFGGQIDPKVAESLRNRIHARWINPGAQPQAAAAAIGLPRAAATAGNAAPAPAASPSPAPARCAAAPAK